MPQYEVTKLYAIVRISPISGVQHVLQLLLTETQWEELQPFLDPSLPKGRSLQEILPDHSPEEREFILSGTTSEEWHKLFGL